MEAPPLSNYESFNRRYTTVADLENKEEKRSFFYWIRRIFFSKKSFAFYFSIFWILLGTYFNCVIQAYLDRESSKLKPLPDLGFLLLPHIHYYKIADIWLYCALGISLIRYLFDKRQNVRVFRRFMFLQGSLFMLRGISIMVTTLPPPLKKCSIEITGNPFVEGLLIMIGWAKTCNDVLFSGHTVTITHLALIWHYHHGLKFHPNYCILLRIGVWMITISGYFMIIATHFHYTIDVFIAICITTFLFLWYRQSLKEIAIKERNFNLLDYFLLWFEDQNDLREEFGSLLPFEPEEHDISP